MKGRKWGRKQRNERNERNYGTEGNETADRKFRVLPYNTEAVSRPRTT